MSELRSDGVLRTPAHGSWRLQRWDAPAALASVVGCAWATQWKLPPGRTHLQAVLPHPAANLVLEDRRPRFYGPSRERFDRTLTGSGRVLGIRFRPGMLRYLTGSPGERAVDRVLPGDVIGIDASPALRLDALPNIDMAVAQLFDALIDSLQGTPAPLAIEMRDAVELVEQDEAIRTIDDLADRLHRSRRTLQRQFDEHVGLSPAWVIRRYRIRRTLAHGATAGGKPDWAAVARRVGYYDQSHLIRDFSSTIGTPPARYIRSAED